MKSKKTKVIIAIIAAVIIIGGLIAGGIYAGNQYQRYLNSQKALELAGNGAVSEDDLKALEENGGFAEFGTEIVDPNTGETVVLTQDENGNIVRTVVTDANGVATGAAIPENHNDRNQDTSHNSNEHVHKWVANTSETQVLDGYDTVTVPEQSHYERHYVCNVCGNYCDNGPCYCNGHANSWHSATVKVVDVPAGSKQVPRYKTKTVVNFYYCVDCGARQ